MNVIKSILKNFQCLTYLIIIISIIFGSVALLEMVNLTLGTPDKGGPVAQILAQMPDPMAVGAIARNSRKLYRMG